MICEPESLLLTRLDGVTAARIGSACLYLLANPTWIRRRSDAITFPEYRTVRVSSTLDGAIPDDVIDLLELDRVPGQEATPTAGRKRRLIVPLDVLKKVPLVHFDLTVDGRSVSLLSSREIARITAAMLSQIAIDAGEHAACAADLKLLEEISGADSADNSQRAFEALCSSRSASTILLDQAEIYRDHYLLLAELTTDEPNLIVKYARDEILWVDLTRRQKLGLRRTPVDVPLASIGRCGSYHVEAITPSELKICDARLVDGDGEPLEHTSRSPRAFEEARDRVSLYASRPPETDGRLIVEVSSHSSVVLRPATIIASVSTIALIVGGGLALHGALGKTLSGSAASALFLTPSIATGLVLNRGEAPLVRLMLAGPRVMLASVAGLMLLGGSLLAFGVHGRTLGVEWLVLAVFTAGLATILVLAYWTARVKPHRRGKRRRDRPHPRGLVADSTQACVRRDRR